MVATQASRSASLIASLAIALGVGCTEPATQLVVVVDSDLDAPTELSRVEVRVGNGEDEVGPTTFDLTTQSLPLSFGVGPGEGSDEAYVVVQGVGPFVDGEQAPLVRRARTTFVEGESLMLPVFLGRACAGVVCEGGLTCDAGQCVPEAIDSATLPPYSPGDETRHDGGVGERDGGVDPAGFVVTPTSPLETTEAGGTATFDVMLVRQPTSYVVVALSSDAPSEGTVSPETITFTPLDWRLPHTVTVTGVDDANVDGNQRYTVVLAPAASGDPSFDGVDPRDVELENVDDDTVAIALEGAEGLSTTERGGTASFTVALTSAPTAIVTIAVSVDDPSEAVTETESVTFDPDDWDVPQTITIRGVDDEDLDGPITYGVVLDPSASAAPEYAALDAASITLMNTDDDTAGITVTPSAGLRTTEGGGAATFTVELNNRPSAPVQIDFAVGDTTEGTVSPSRVSFGPEQWREPATITVTGADDDASDGDVTYEITATITTADVKYGEVAPTTVTVTNEDDDFPDVLVSPTVGLVTNEDGTTATFSIRLRSEPAADVTIALSSSDPSEGTVSPASVVLNATNWNVHQTVTVTGVDDDAADGPAAFTIVTAASVSADSLYDGIDAPNVQVTNTDDDQPGVLVAPSSLTVSEAETTATFTVRLATMPSSNVTIPIASMMTSEVTASPAALTFTPLTWMTPQTVTVTGVDDDIDDGDRVVTVATGEASSLDTDYAGMDAADVLVTNTDDDTANVVVTAAAMLMTTEAGSSATFTVRLASQPTQSVTIGLSSGDPTEGTVTPSAVTFTTTNWATAQTVTVTGVDDAVEDGDVQFSVVTAPAAGAPEYVGLNAPNPSVTNVDDDTAGATVTPSGAIVVAESGATSMVSVVLGAQPTANVVVQPQVTGGSGEITVTPATATFTTSNWNTPITFTVAAVDDDMLDGDADVSLSFAFTSSDPNYGGSATAAMTVTAIDDGMLTATNISDPSGPPANAAGSIAVSMDARVIAFSSSRGNLVPGDSNQLVDLFVFDRSDLGYERVSVSSSGAQANGVSDSPAVSGNGRFVAFASDASNLVSGDTNGARDVFLRDRQTTTTIRVSVSGSTQSTAASRDPAISSDGRFIAYAAGAGLAPAGHCIAVYDRTTGTTTGGGVGTTCRSPRISTDGNVVAFLAGTATTAVVVVRDRAAGTQTTLSPAGASEPFLTDAGRYVAFTSPDHASIAADTNNLDDVIVFDRTTSSYTLASAATGGADGASFGASLTSDGQYAVFASAASNLVASAPASINLYERDRVTNATRRLVSGVSDVYRAVVSPDGRFVAYLDASAPYGVFVVSR